MKKIILLFVLCISLVGCSKDEATKTNENAQTESIVEEIELNESQMESDGYVNISDIAFIKLEDSTGSITSHINCISQNTEECMYVWNRIGEETDFNNDNTILTWNGEEYHISESSGIDAFPKEWSDMMIEVAQNNYKLYENMSEELTAKINDEVKTYVNDTIKPSEQSESTIVKSEKYAIDGLGEVSIVTSVNGEEFSFTVFSKAPNVENSALIFLYFENIFEEVDVPKYTIHIYLGDDSNRSLAYTISNGDKYITAMNSDGSMSFGFPEWFNENSLGDLTDEEIEIYYEKLNEIKDDYFQQ